MRLKKKRRLIHIRKKKKKINSLESRITHIETEQYKERIIKFIDKL